MSRVCLVGVGEPAFRPAPVHIGPGLRVAHLAAALQRSGCELLVVLVHNGSSSSRLPPHPIAGSASVDGRSVRTLDLAETALTDPRVDSHIRAFAPDALVGATTLGAALACRLRLGVPLWADVFGDFMAEAQAKALVHGDDSALARFWMTLQPVLHHADRFSAVSNAQAHALIGQLGLAGRLTAGNAGVPLVHVIPCAAEAPSADAIAGVQERIVGSEAFVVAWSGSFNTWCDVETLFAGLERAMRRVPNLVFLATGGAVAGHDDTSYRRFSAWVATSPLRNRFRLMGWVPSDLANAYCYRANLGIVVERDLYERCFGSENRVVHWMARSIPCATTGRSELGCRLVRRGLALGFAPGDPEALADVLVAAAHDPERVRAMGRACAAYCQEHFTFDRTARALVGWCHAPTRASDQGRPRPVTLGSLSEPATMAQLLEAYLAELPLRTVAYRSLRWLWRRGARRGRNRMRIASKPTDCG